MMSRCGGYSSEYADPVSRVFTSACLRVVFPPTRSIRFRLRSARRTVTAADLSHFSVFNYIIKCWICFLKARFSCAVVVVVAILSRMVVFNFQLKSEKNCAHRIRTVTRTYRISHLFDLILKLKWKRVVRMVSCGRDCNLHWQPVIRIFYVIQISIVSDTHS